MPNTRKNGSVENALRVLDVLASAPEPMGVTQIAAALDLTKSVAHSILATLRAAEFVEQVAARRYQLGLGALRIGSAATPRVAADGRYTPYLWELAHATGEAVSIAIRHQTDAVIVQRVESGGALRADLRVGTRMPLYASASGKCFLANMTKPEIDNIYPAELLKVHTKSTIETKEDLYKELAIINQQGYATNDEESIEGVSGIAVLVQSQSATPLALSIAAPTVRFDMDRFKEILLTISQRIYQLDSRSADRTVE